MLDAIKTLDLNSLPADVRAVLLGVGQRNVELEKSNAAHSTQNAELEAVNARLEHFVKELNQVIYGTRSEKLTEDERQLAFEDIEVAQFEAEEQSDRIEKTTPQSFGENIGKSSHNSLRAFIRVLIKLLCVRFC
jgi:transposase